MSYHRRRHLPSIMRGANYDYYAIVSSAFRAVETRTDRDAAFSFYRNTVMRSLSEGDDEGNMDRRVNNSAQSIDASEAGRSSMAQGIDNYRDFMLRNQEYETLILNGLDRDLGILDEETLILNGVHQDSNLYEEIHGGLTEEFIANYLRTRNGNDEDEESKNICVVCQDDLCQENHTIAMLECGHEFHTPCIKEWLKRKNICPLCNAVALNCR